MKILIVDDNAQNSYMARFLLEKHDHQVIEAGDAEHGIDLARDEHPDLILMDLSLPGMSGLEATAVLKADAATSSIPVIAFTAQAMRGDREQALRAGCCDYISKPIDTSTFVTQVEQHP